MAGLPNPGWSSPSSSGSAVTVVVESLLLPTTSVALFHKRLWLATESPSTFFRPTC